MADSLMSEVLKKVGLQHVRSRELHWTLSACFHGVNWNIDGNRHDEAQTLVLKIWRFKTREDI